MEEDRHRVNSVDSFLNDYRPSELRVASEILTRWLPFISKDLCSNCTESISDRIRSLESEIGDYNIGKSQVLTKNDCDENCVDSNAIEGFDDDSTAEAVQESTVLESVTPRRSWADMAQEDELLAEEEEKEELQRELNKREDCKGTSTGELRIPTTGNDKFVLSREHRERIRFLNVKRKKDYICLERVKGKFVNILEGLELHTSVFSAAEQKRIVDYIYTLEKMGRKGELKERTFTAPKKWMRGKGRVTIQFGCCYNYATDKNGNPPGILQNENVDPLPDLFKVIIRRLVKWHVLPTTCVPDSCIVNIYEEGDCIPPHIDNHDFVRPFCTISFLSECDIVFGTNLEIIGPGEFAGPISIPLPVGSVLVLQGNGADVAKHCVPAVPAKRISITFRRMDESKRPNGFVPEPDLQGILPLSYDVEKTNGLNTPNSEYHSRRHPYRRGARGGRGETRAYSQSEPRFRSQNREGSGSKHGDRDQIRILKDLYYNNGIRSPTADQIQRISTRLRQYGKIEGKNVFYWFQNHKARERQKKRFGASSINPTTSTLFNNNMTSNSNMQPQQKAPNSPHVSTNNILKYNCPTSQGFSSASQSSNGMVTIGHNYGGGGGHASLNMEKSFKDCTISTNNGGEAVNHNNKVHDNLGWVGFDPYSSSNIFDQKNNNYSINVEEIEDDQNDDQDDHENINIIEYQYHHHHHQVNIGHQELETLPLFPMHGEDINGGGFNGGGEYYGGFYGNSSSEHHHYYGGGSSRASLELSLNSYFSGF
ncbi:hypothetical protein ACFE04_001059 [Oxalis oulophora]